MNRLTTNEEFPHGAEGKRADKLTGYWCRGEFEATACVEKLSRYENTGLEPEEIEGMLYKWIPVAERLPEKPKENPLYDNKPLEIYLVSVKNTNCVIRAFWNGTSFTDGWDKPDVLAWMPLPEPYKEEEGGTGHDKTNII